MEEMIALPPNQKRIYLALDDHTDYMWTADEETYQQAFLEMLDYYIEMAGQTATNLPDFQSRFCCDGTLWAYLFEQNRSPEEFQRLIQCIRSGHITVPLNPAILTYGGAPLEAVLRGMFYGGVLERRFNLRFHLALAMENQTIPYGLGALLAGSGVKYSWKGICACASHLIDAWDRPQDIYWWEGQDGSRILMKWNSLLVDNKNMGGYAEARDPAASLELVETNPEFKRRYPYNITGIFGKGWDDLKTLTQDFVAFAQQNSTPERRIIVSNEIDFFEDFNAQYGNTLPVQASAYGNEWDLYTASISEAFSGVRRAVEMLRPAEALAVLCGLKDPSQRKTMPEKQRDQLWMDLGLFYEHDLTADGPISRDARNAWHRQKGAGVIRHADELLETGLQTLGTQIQYSGPFPRFFTFNPLSWARSCLAELPYQPAGPYHVIDLSTGLQVPAQFVDRDGKPFIQIFAENVPPVGYKVFEIRPGSAAPVEEIARFDGNILENETMRIILDETGAIASWIDFSFRWTRTCPSAEWARDQRPGRANSAHHSGALWTGFLYDPGGFEKPAAHTRRYTLVRGQRWIDIRNEIT